MEEAYMKPIISLLEDNIQRRMDLGGEWTGSMIEALAYAIEQNFLNSVLSDKDLNTITVYMSLDNAAFGIKQGRISPPSDTSEMLLRGFERVGQVAQDLLDYAPEKRNALAVLVKQKIESDFDALPVDKRRFLRVDIDTFSAAMPHSMTTFALTILRKAPCDD